MSEYSGRITWVGPEDSPFREMQEEQMKKSSRLNSMASMPNANHFTPRTLQMAGAIYTDPYDVGPMVSIKTLSDLFSHFPKLREEIMFAPDATEENKAFLYYAVTEVTRTVKQKPIAHYCPKVGLFHTEDELRQYLVEMLEQPLLTVLLTGRRGNWQLFDWSGVADGYDFACPGDWLMIAMFGDNMVFCKHDVRIKFDVSGEHAEAIVDELPWNGELGYIPRPLNHPPRPILDELTKLAYYSVSGQRRLNFLEHRQMGQIKMTKQLVISAAEDSGWFDKQTGKCTVVLQALLDAAVRGV